MTVTSVPSKIAQNELEGKAGVRAFAATDAFNKASKKWSAKIPNLGNNTYGFWKVSKVYEDSGVSASYVRASRDRNNCSRKKQNVSRLFRF